MVRLLSHPRNLPARYYRYIGEIAARWSMVELHLQEIVWCVLGLGPKEGRLLTYWPGAREKIEVFKALSKHSAWISNTLTATYIDMLATEVNRLNTLRNDYAHGIFGHEPGKRSRLELFYTRKTAQKIRPHAQVKTVDDIKKVASDIAVLQDRLRTLADALSRHRDLRPQGDLLETD